MPHQRKESSGGFKSRFSLSSLLPARHPPLVISHPAPLVPTQQVHRAQPHLRTSDRVEPSYGLTLTALASPSQYSLDSSVSADAGETRWDAHNVFTSPQIKPTPKHRPPPLDLTRTKALFPTVKGVSLVHDDPSPPPPAEPSPTRGKVDDSLPKRNESLPVARGASDLKKAASKAGRMFKTSNNAAEKKPKPVRAQRPTHDSYDFVTLEPEHRYPSWKAGKVDIRPGEHIPPHLLRVDSSDRGAGAKKGARSGRQETLDSTPSPEPEQYESVLHNVLLTPTYLAPSTASKSTTDLMGNGRVASKRQTLLARASRWGKDMIGAVPTVGGSLAQYGRSTRPEREREEREMQQVQSGGKPRPGQLQQASTPQAKRERAVSSASSLSTPSPAIRGVVGTPYRRSPAWTSMREREESVGFDRGRKVSEPRAEGGGGSKRPLVGFNVSWKENDGKRSVSVSEAWSQKKKKEQDIKRKRLIWRCGLALVFIILAAVAIGVLVSRLTGRRSAEAPDSSSTDEEAGGTVSQRATSTTPTLPAPTASDAPQNLKTCIEQYAQASANPTGYPCSECVPLLSFTVNDFETPLVGGNSTNVGAALQFCALMDVYRATPGLQGEGWAGSGGVCGWKGVLCDDRGRVTQLVLEYPNVPPTLGDTIGSLVALDSFKLLGNHTIPGGSIPGRLLRLPNLTELDLEFTAFTGPMPDSLDTLPRLQSLTLVNNQQLGGNIPNLSGNRDLSTLVITGQKLRETNFDTFPSSLTYLDLSFNSFDGAVPSLIQLTSLHTLYMTNNNFATPPNSLPTSLQTLSLISNPSLNGSMPSTLCSNANLRSCDLRNTNLANTGGNSNVQNSTSAISAVGGGAGRVCGPCRFV